MAPTDLRRLLLAQALAAAEEFRAVESYFQRADRAAGDRAASLGDAAAACAKSLESSVEAASAPPGWRKDVFLVSRALARMCAEGRLIVEEARRFGVPEDPALKALAHEARRSAEELAESVDRLSKDPRAAQAKATAAFRAAGRTEHERREAARELGKEPDAVLVLKLRGLHDRFAKTALHAADAAELLGRMLVEWR